MGIDLEGFGATFAAGLLVVVGISALLSTFSSFHLIPRSEKALGASKAVFVPMFGILAFGLGLLIEDISDKFVDRLGWTDNLGVLQKNDMLRLRALFDVNFYVENQECENEKTCNKPISRKEIIKLNILGEDIFRHCLVDRYNNRHAIGAYELLRKTEIYFKKNGNKNTIIDKKEIFYFKISKIETDEIKNNFNVPQRIYIEIISIFGFGNTILDQYKIDKIINRAVIDTYFSSKNQLYEVNNYFSELTKLDIRRNFARSFTIIMFFLPFVGFLMYLYSMRVYNSRPNKYTYSMKIKITKTNLSVRLIILSIICLLLVIFGRAAFRLESIEYNKRVFGYALTKHRTTEIKYDKNGKSQNAIKQMECKSKSPDKSHSGTDIFKDCRCKLPSGKKSSDS